MKQFQSRTTSTYTSAKVIRWVGWCLLVLLGCLSLPPLPTYQQPQVLHAQGQGSPISFTVDAGFQGYYRLYSWFPVHFTIENDGPDIQGILEWNFPDSSTNMLFQREIELPRGSRKQVTMFVLTQNSPRIGQASLKEKNNVLVKQSFQLNYLDLNQFTVGVVSTNATLLNSLTGMSIPKRTQTVVLHLTPDDLVDNPQAMTTFDVLFLHDVTTADLHQAQLDALRHWVLLGGQLVVSGGVHAGQTSSGLSDMLPVTVGNLTNDVSLASLTELLDTSQTAAPIPTDVTISQVQLRDKAQTLDSQSLLTTRTLGNGQVIFSAFDLGALRAWINEPELWSQVLWNTVRFDPTLSYVWYQNLLLDIVQLAILRLPSFWTLLIFILSYIVIIGPLNFFILHRIKRVELAWITIPVLVLFFVFGTYGGSFLVRGNTPELLHVSIVQGFEGEQWGQETTHMGIFSPKRQAYTVSFPHDTLACIYDMESFSRNKIIRWNEEKTTLPNFLVDVSSLRTVVLERPLSQMPWRVESSLEIVRGELVGNVKNVGDISLTDALLVYGNSVQELGTIQPGKEADVKLDRDLFNFPFGANASTEGDFNRQEMLYRISESDSYSVRDLSTLKSGVYLMAWGEKQMIDVQIDAFPINHHRLVLTIIRLDVQ
jgi:hypothetical protein